MITQSELQKLLHYDPNTGLFTWRQHRYPIFIGKIVGRKHVRGYLEVRIKKKYYLLHRLAWIYVNGREPETIDHINGIKTDNRISNLRNCSQRENCQNLLPGKRNTSGYLGVHKDKKSGKFRAEIGVDNQNIYLGMFDTAEEASEAYLKAKAQYHTFNPILRPKHC